MPNWDDPGARDVFANSKAYQDNYCRFHPSAETLVGVTDNKTQQIEERLNISKWLSEVVPHAVHRTNNYNGFKPWLSVGRVGGSKGILEGISRIDIFWRNDNYWIQFPTPDDETKDLKEKFQNTFDQTEINEKPAWKLNLSNNDQKEKLAEILTKLEVLIFKNELNENAKKYLDSNHILGQKILMPSARKNELSHTNKKEGQDQPELPLVQYLMNTQNIILYGPPGTGKTFATVGLALYCSGLENDDVQEYAENCLTGGYSSPPGNSEAWNQWLNEFEQLRKQGRIEFTTFHQNYAYEDFVEGIRAQTNAGGVSYATEPGIFKKIAYRALYAWLKGDGQPCPIGAEEEQLARKAVLQWLTDGTRNPEWGPEPSDAVAPPYILIIDEINRGNMARILGELITLLEDSKRARHQKELGHQPLKATLPYTREPFIVPPNLYIIGTMNTADRSLIGLDVALRRRFQFVELPPRPEALATTHDGVDLNAFLTALNKRIVRQLDADHLIGHAFFVGVKTTDELKNVMIQKVIPLLREYFHDRPDALQIVLRIDANRNFAKFDGRDTSLRFVHVDSDELSNSEAYAIFAAFAE